MSILPLNQGGTGSDLSGTGGAGQVVKQTSAGADLSVAAIAISDLPTSGTWPFSGTVSGNPTVSGNLTATAGQNSLNAYNINNVLYVDGIEYTTVLQALNQIILMGGGTIDMRGNSSAAALDLSNYIDVGNGGVPVTILLGPYTYTAQQIVCRTNTEIIGMAGTFIQSTNISGPLVVFSTNSGDSPAFKVHLRRINFYGPGAGSNGQPVYDYVAPKVTSFSINASDVASFVCDNNFVAGQTVVLGGFVTGTYFNNQTVTVSATGLSSTGFQASFTHGAVSSTSESSAFATPNVDCMYFDSISGTTGCWYSLFEDLFFQGFGGNVIHFATGDPTSATSQWLTFLNCYVYRGAGGGNALRVEAANYFLTFINGELDGYNGNDSIAPDTNANIYIGGSDHAGMGSGQSYPYIISFRDVAIQGAETLVQIDGGFRIKFDNCHFEQGYTAFSFTSGIQGVQIATVGIAIDNCSFNGTVGVHSGSGAIINFDSSANAWTSAVKMSDAMYPGTSPDNWVVNAQYCPTLSLINNTQGGENGTPATALNPVATLTTIQKSGSKGGNYTTTSTGFTAVDSTNLKYTVTIPIDWKLIVRASGVFQNDTPASGQAILAIVDGTTPIAATTWTGSGAVPFYIETTIIGDGTTSHVLELQFKTSNVANTVEILNTTPTFGGFPTMTFVLTPSL
jgi:hypothetical protein